MFTELKDCTVTLLLNGVYRVFPVAEKEKKIFAKIGKASYVKISRGGSTSTKARWIYISGMPDDHKDLLPWESTGENKRICFRQITVTLRKCISRMQTEQLGRCIFLSRFWILPVCRMR